MEHGGRHRGRPDTQTLMVHYQYGDERHPPIERNKARHTRDSNRAITHNTDCCPVCDPEGYAAERAKHRGVPVWVVLTGRRGLA